MQNNTITTREETRSSLATPEQVAQFLGTSVKSLANQRYLGTGPKYIKINGSAVRYRWSDVESFLDNQTFSRTDSRVSQ